MSNKDSEELPPVEIVRRAIEAKGGKKALKQEWGRRVFGGRNKKPDLDAMREASIKANLPGGPRYETMKRKREEEEITKRTSRELQLRRATQGDIAAYDEGPKDIKENNNGIL
tara:strand:+ start:78 stop:416 length:339 start_codon:yes stop_codon:yes gene_type:complete